PRSDGTGKTLTREQALRVSFLCPTPIARAQGLRHAYWAARSSATAAWMAAAISEIRATFCGRAELQGGAISSANIISTTSIASAAPGRDRHAGAPRAGTV